MITTTTLQDAFARIAVSLFLFMLKFEFLIAIRFSISTTYLSANARPALTKLVPVRPQISFVY